MKVKKSVIKKLIKHIDNDESTMNNIYNIMNIEKYQEYYNINCVDIYNMYFTYQLGIKDFEILMRDIKIKKLKKKMKLNIGKITLFDYTKDNNQDGDKFSDSIIP